MYGHLVILGLGTAAISAGISWVIALRHGRKAAMLVPLLAFIVLIFMLWRASGLGFHDGIGITAAAVVIAAPAIGGALLGIVLSRQQGK